MKEASPKVEMAVLNELVNGNDEARNLADRSGQSVSSTKRALRQLKAAGVVTWSRKRGWALT